MAASWVEEILHWLVGGSSFNISFFVSAIHDIVDMAKKGHYQIACSKYFDAVHNTDLGLGINHPNQYFEDSQKLQKGDVKVEPKKEIQPTIKKESVHDMEEVDFDDISEWKE